MFKEIVQGIGGSSLYSIIAMILLITAFTAIVIRTVRLDRRHLDHMGQLPLDSSPSADRNGEDCHV